MNPGDVRDRLNRRLAVSPRGEAAEIAVAAGLSRSTISKFRNGTYPGTLDDIAERIGEVLNRRDLVDDLVAGRLKPAWLIHSRRGVRLVKQKQALDRIMSRNPGARIIPLWWSPDRIFVGRSGGSGDDETQPDAIVAGL